MQFVRGLRSVTMMCVNVECWWCRVRMGKGMCEIFNHLSKHDHSPASFGKCWLGFA